LIAAALATLLATPVMAQNLDERFVGRHVNQQERILEGLQRGMLTVQEAGDLERQAARVERLERDAWMSGGISRHQRQEIRHGLRQLSMQIRDEMRDGQTTQWHDASQDRMVRLVQRSVNQGRRIEQGLHSGELTPQEAARLMGGQARVHRRQAVAAADGVIDNREMIAIRDLERRQNHRIFRQKHDNQAEAS
jgi:hypothetical protein